MVYHQKLTTCDWVQADFPSEVQKYGISCKCGVTWRQHIQFVQLYQGLVLVCFKNSTTIFLYRHSPCPYPSLLNKFLTGYWSADNTDRVKTMLLMTDENCLLPPDY